MHDSLLVLVSELLPENITVHFCRKNGINLSSGYLCRESLLMWQTYPVAATSIQPISRENFMPPLYCPVKKEQLHRGEVDQFSSVQQMHLAKKEENVNEECLEIFTAKDEPVEVPGSLDHSVDVKYEKDTYTVNTANLRNYEQQDCKQATLCDKADTSNKNHGEALLQSTEKYYKCSICNFKTQWRGSVKRHMLQHFSFESEGVDQHSHASFQVKDVKHLYNPGQSSNKVVDDNTNCSDQKTNLSTCNGEDLLHETSKYFKCSECNFKTKWYPSSKRHMLLHSKLKPFICSFCNFKTQYKDRLKQHMLIHTNTKPYSCLFCNYKARQLTRLKQHVLRHTNTKPYCCSVCDYRARVKSTLEQHMLLHTDTKPFDCSVCEYQTRNERLLKNHMLRHTNLKPFQCSSCNYKARRKCTLRQHMLMHYKSPLPFESFIGGV